MDLKNTIVDLIDSKKEGDYWDFKEKWYDNRADLLHDIICLANNRVGRDAYIIIGVEDKTFNIKGIQNDLNRKNQQNVIDFLKSKNFCGGIRPDIEVRTINILSDEIDVLVIKNSFDTPYFLLEDYRDRTELVRKYSIYTRVGDTNTPKDGIADIDQIEYLWKKRFLLTESPIKRIFDSLKDKENWDERYVKGETIYYYKYNPEYTLVVEEEEDDLYPEFYSMVMINKNQSYLNLNIKYYGTIVFQCQLTYLDGARLLVPTPNWGFIRELERDRTQGAYKYYIYNSDTERLLNFFFDETIDEQEYAKNRFDEVVLYFESNNQRKDFESYISSIKDDVNREIDEEIKKLDYIKCTKDAETNYMRTHIAIGIVLNKYLEKYIVELT
ncbi:MAG: ATP-binding protein [Bacilli bacterium]|nr:ATP-binding protein [Bacilli bacterium]